MNYGIPPHAIIPCVTLCGCFCRTALLYLGQVAVVNENLFSTSLNKGEINKKYFFENEVEGEQSSAF
jgi:hypothetical protein